MNKLLFFSIILLGFTSCDTLTKSSRNTDIATGKPGEVLVMCSDELWNSPEMDSLIYALAGEEEPYYPMEYNFRFYQKNVIGFTSLYKKVRNIMIIERQQNARYSPAQVKLVKNKWVTDQLVVEITYQHKEDLLNLIRFDAAKIFSAFEEIEIERNEKAFQAGKMEPLRNKLAEKYGIRFHVPSGTEIRSNLGDFMRLDLPERSREMVMDGGPDFQTQKANFILSSILIWQQDYRDKAQLTPESLLQFQDSTLKVYAPHERKGAYMGTEYDSLVYPVSRVFEHNGLYTVEIKGQYRMNGRDDVFMGGPFVSYSFVHPTTNKLITVFGLVHGPSETLINYIREHKAIFRTLTVDESKTK
jgi:hypothetical protein